MEEQLSKEILSIYKQLYLSKPDIVSEIDDISLFPEEFLVDVIKSNIHTFPHFKTRTHNMIKTALEADWSLLRVIPREERTPQLCEFSIDKNIRAAKYCPFDDVLEKKITQYPNMLEFCEEQTFQLCALAVATDMNTLNFIRDPLIRKQIQKILI